MFGDYFDAGLLSSFAISIVFALLYTWFFDQSIPDNPDAGPEPQKLSRSGERLRWRIAAICMFAVLAVLLWGNVKSWGAYVAVMIGAAGYFTSNIVTTGVGAYEITASQQSWRRRAALIPAGFVFYRYTDFAGSSLWEVFLLSVALVTALALILVPEPRE
jgi:hypothetical protein